MSKIIADGVSFSCETLTTSGEDNNCLGYALRDALNGTPQELRECLVEHVRNGGDILAMSIIPDCCDVDAAVEALRDGCFIPADVFVNFLQTGNRGIVKPVSIVFFSEDDGVYTPVLCHWDDTQRTYYIGSDNMHYSALYVRNSASLDLMLRARDN